MAKVVKNHLSIKKNSKKSFKHKKETEKFFSLVNYLLIKNITFAFNETDETSYSHN